VFYSLIAVVSVGAVIVVVVAAEVVATAVVGAAVVVVVVTQVDAPRILTIWCNPENACV
jgi:hypothetical protein